MSCPSDRCHEAQSYLECMTRTFISGLSATFFTLSGTYLSMSLLKNRMPMLRPERVRFGLAALMASVVGARMIYGGIRTCNWKSSNQASALIESTSKPTETC